MPANCGRSLGVLIGWFAFHFSPRRRCIAQKNIAVCFPHLTAQQKEDLVRKVFFESGVGLVESSWVWFKRSSNVTFTVSEEDEQLLMDAVTRGKGVLLLCPHYTMLELSAVIINKIVGRFVITYRPQEAEWLDKLICDGRSTLGDLVNVRDLRAIISSLKNGRVVWFGPDQDMGPRGSVFAKFFGVPTCTVTTPARLARATDCRVVFCSLRRERGNYHVGFSLMSDAYPYDDEVTNARELNNKIERAVETFPAQYMWVHRRFKTNPDGSRHSFYD